MPPPYSSRAYWDQRFTKEDSFDWLLPTSAILPIISEQLHKSPSSKAPNILHIGCGNSDISTYLPDLAGPNGSVTNVDFSETVIASSREKANAGSSPQMENKSRWLAADFLSLPEIQTILFATPGRAAGYDLILDKSTSDSISCGDDIGVSLPYHLQLADDHRTNSISGRAETLIHPLALLALHLAFLAPKVGSRWLVFSYSAHRFPWLEGDDEQQDSCAAASAIAGFPEVAKLWTLEAKWSLNVPVTDADQESDRKGHVVHRPPELCWVYVLVRTDVEVVHR